MCLTPTAMLAFLSMISPDIYETTQERIIVRAETGDVTYTVRDGHWCIAPAADS